MGHVLHVSDSVAPYRQYCSCMQELYNRPTIQEKGKRGPFANKAEAAMEDVYTYLENSDGGSQFPLNKLMDQIKGPEKRQSKLI